MKKLFSRVLTEQEEEFLYNFLKRNETGIEILSNILFCFENFIEANFQHKVQQTEYSRTELKNAYDKLKATGIETNVLQQETKIEMFSAREVISTLLVISKKIKNYEAEHLTNSNYVSAKIKELKEKSRSPTH